MRPVILLTVAACGLGAPQSQELPRWVLELSRVKRHLRANFERLPNYVCLQTVNRFEKAPNVRDFRLVDTWRLDVAQVGNHEMLALAGTGSLEAEAPPEVLQQGAFGTGAYSSLARNLFVNDAGRTTGWGEEQMDGRAAFRFDFEIPQMVSAYLLQSGSAKAIVGERGSYWVDAASLDLLRMEDSATDIPPTLPIQEVRTAIRYAKVRIGASEVILPQSAETTIVNFDGRQSRNVMDFSGCREYGSESKITFGEPVPAQDLSLPAPGRKGVPARKKK